MLSTTALISFLLPPHKTRRVKGVKSEKKIKSMLNRAEMGGRVSFYSRYHTVSSRRSGGRKTYLISPTDRKKPKKKKEKIKKTNNF